MKKIHPLPQEVIAKIAAGEVIERPAYAVKEVVENAIDAHADNIILHIEDSGLKKITIIDNGEGMSIEDIQECFKPHTTSKISSEENLSNIQTLGFRGEALASIAAISHMIIKSKTKEDTAGTNIEIRAGQVEKISPTGIPVGTHITINNLFYTVPGRKNFLRNSRTEFRHIIDLVTQYALIYPNIRFFLSHNHRTIFDLPHNSDILERIKTLLGTTIYNYLLSMKKNISKFQAISPNPKSQPLQPTNSLFSSIKEKSQTNLSLLLSKMRMEHCLSQQHIRYLLYFYPFHINLSMSMSTLAKKKCAL